MNLKAVLNSYDYSKLTIGSLGGHSALDICLGAKLQGFRTVVVAQKGRQKTYAQYYKSQGELGIVDEIILVDNFKDVTSPSVVNQLKALNTIFIQSRYFWVYCDHHAIETNFPIPLMGTRGIVKLEERDQPLNQYHLLAEAGLRAPKFINNPQDIKSLVIVKVPEKSRPYERAFFLAQSEIEYRQKCHELVKLGKIIPESLEHVHIEEFILGTQINFNFFYSPLEKRVELMGTDIRRQTSLDGWLRLPAADQLELSHYQTPSYIETGHLAVTVKESLIEKAHEAAEKLIKVTHRKFPPGIIGPFALQGAIISGPPKEELVIFDLSLRVPGSPGITATPYSSYLYHRPVSMGERIAIEINQALKTNRLRHLLS